MATFSSARSAFAVVTIFSTLAAIASSSRRTDSVTGASVTFVAVNVTPGRTPVKVSLDDSTVYAPAPSPTVMRASRAAVDSTSPPIWSKTEPSRSIVPSAPLVVDVSWRRY